ncbi:alpha/beta hydrolase-fold protein [Actinomadura litoris]|uniref:Enterochelin esterase n=1 Tax=Actinomadura litoris TaxID=2678616 RepID=A0A7K1LE06_9ACTN|nr:alpha/beta hydrolase-fold protein [Actinomadura litoris]MUN42671.1 enterochelin esterase [Actinomadura litoris]
MLPWLGELSGRLDDHEIHSELLRGNPLGDPHKRPLWVYVPPGYDDSSARYPTIYVLQGYFGRLEMWLNRMPFQRPFIEAADALFAGGEAEPALLVFVDAWTTYGGSQFLDSPGTGRYHSYLCDEIVPFVDRHYRTLPERDHRGIVGKSSGGYGAMVTPMLRPDLFGALATHAGDALFEYTCFSKFPLCVRHLRAYGGDILRWWEDFRSRSPRLRPEDVSLHIMLGMAACLSPGGDGVPELPFDPVSGRLRPAVWRRWLALDPVRMVARHAAALRSARGVWIDGGTADEQFLDVGAQAFRHALAEAGVPSEITHFELFPGGHNGIERRYPLSLAWLTERLAAPSRASNTEQNP